MIMAGGQYHTRHLLVTDMFEEQTFLVDGVGCHNGILHPSLAYNYYTDLWSFVSCTTPGGETVTAADISSEAVEYNGCNPEIVATPRLKNNTLIHDLQGRRLNGIPQKGVYIQNGRKYVK